MIKPKTLMSYPDERVEIAMFALRKHYEYHDPYVDDMPTARHEAARHRAECAFCQAYESMPKVRER